jgi:hypothetical protein
MLLTLQLDVGFCCLCCWAWCRGDGFATGADTIQRFSIEDPNPFFTELMSKPYRKQVVLSPHFYGQSITNSTLTDWPLWEALTKSWGQHMVRVTEYSCMIAASVLTAWHEPPQTSTVLTYDRDAAFQEQQPCQAACSKGITLTTACSCRCLYCYHETQQLPAATLKVPSSPHLAEYFRGGNVCNPDMLLIAAG